MRSRAALALLLVNSSGCGLFVGVDWDRVVVADGGPGAPGADGSSTSGPPGSEDGSVSGADGSPSSGGDGGVKPDSAPPVTCVAPQVRCIAGCCDDNADPGLPNGISAGQTDSCAVTTTGKVRCWGSNVVGQLGRGQGPDSQTPTTAYHIPSGAASVAIGDAHGCAVVSGLLGCWGANGSGQVGFDSTPSSLGVEEPGRVQNLQGKLLSVAVGTAHSCAVVDGTAYCWGSNAHGELATSQNVYRSSTPLTVGQLGSGVVGIGAAGSRACAIVSGGGVTCWGSDNPPTTISGISGATQIAVAPFHACVLVGGNVQCWGMNLSGELGNDSNGGNTPTSPTGLPAGVTQITANGSHTCAVVNAQAWCWGANESGQLGRDTGLASGAPAQIAQLSGVQALAAGGNHTCALFANNTLKCWGRNDEGELGDGTKSGGFTPVSVHWP
jgi:alpha-tubulin suppressor-like RCC1 family protein